jgi:hypothetical protein
MIAVSDVAIYVIIFTENFFTYIINGDRKMSDVEKLEQLYALLNIVQHTLETPNSDIFSDDIAILIQLAKTIITEIKTTH